MSTLIPIMTACLCLSVGQRGGREYRPADKIVGAVWEVTFKMKEAKNDVTRKYRATPDGKVWTVAPPRAAVTPKVIGSWKGDAEKTTMTITGADDQRFNGDFDLTMIRKSPPTWQGKFTNDRGRNFPISIKLLRD